MIMNKSGLAMLAVGIIITVVWVSMTPEVFHTPAGPRGCPTPAPQQCVADTNAMALRFVMGSAAAFVIALAVSAAKKEKDTDNAEQGASLAGDASMR